MTTPRLSPWRLTTAATLVAGLATLSGCTFINAYEDPAIVGDWKREIAGFDQDDEMSLDVEGGGDGRIFVNGTTGVLEAEFDIEWKYRQPDQYTLDWECTNNACDGVVFTLRCDINNAGDKLECVDRSNVWQDPEFNWEAD